MRLAAFSSQLRPLPLSPHRLLIPVTRCPRVEADLTVTVAAGPGVRGLAVAKLRIMDINLFKKATMGDIARATWGVPAQPAVIDSYLYTVSGAGQNSFVTLSAQKTIPQRFLKLSSIGIFVSAHGGMAAGKLLNGEMWSIEGGVQSLLSFRYSFEHHRKTKAIRLLRFSRQKGACGISDLNVLCEVKGTAGGIVILVGLLHLFRLICLLGRWTEKIGHVTMTRNPLTRPLLPL